MKQRTWAIVFCVVMVAFMAIGCAAKTEPDQAPQEATNADGNAAQEVATKDGVVTYNIDMSQYADGEVVRVWLPIAQTNEYQTIENIIFDAGDATAELTADALGNTMLYLEWTANAQAANRNASCSFHVSRSAVVSPELQEEGAVPADLAEYLGASSTIPLDGVVKAQADAITEGQETTLEKARAIYDWIIANMNRDESIVGCGLGDVCTLLDTRAGKCTDINSVFVGLCRAAGIPAREMFGVRLNDTNITGNQHCWAEFYVPGTGWVLADPADVLRAVLKNDWTKDAAETKETQEFYWGNSEAERVELSRGRDIVLSPQQEGQALNNFGYPYAEVNGQAIDFYAPDAFVYTISFIED